MQMFSSSRKVEPGRRGPHPGGGGLMTATPPPPPAAKPEPPPNGAPELARPGGTLSSGVSIKGTVKFQKELLIDCEEDRALRAVLVGMLREPLQ